MLERGIIGRSALKRPPPDLTPQVPNGDNATGLVGLWESLPSGWDSDYTVASLLEVREKDARP